MVVLCGIDLAGSAKKASGIALMNIRCSKKHGIEVHVLYDDSEIIRYVFSSNEKPVAIAIDAPLSLPPKDKWFREVDIVMKRKGFRVLPPRWHGMKMLTLRAIKLKNFFERHGIKVVETHPRSAMKSSGCASLRELLDKLNIDIINKDYDDLMDDEIDAIIACIVAWYFWRSKAYSIVACDGAIYLLPRIC